MVYYRALYAIVCYIIYIQTGTVTSVVLDAAKVLTIALNLTLDSFAGVFISYRGRNYSNYALFGHSGIALQTPLLCKTDLDSCCTSVDNPNGGGQGMWYYPSGVQVPAGGVAKAGQIYGRTRSSQAVRLHRTAPGIPAANGIYRCAVSDRNHVLQKRYVGLYTHGTGEYNFGYTAEILGQKVY